MRGSGLRGCYKGTGRTPTPICLAISQPFGVQVEMDFSYGTEVVVSSARVR